ncbi:MAG: DUF4279 domain-containing protein [Nitrosomonas sp. PRO4]|nr:DUF4279 domain-containing protein [Nitrosomonas sp. PRO4]
MHEFPFKVSLRIFSKTVDPTEICNQLDLEPEWIQTVGEPRINPKGIVLGGVYENSYCSFLINLKNHEELHETLDRVVDNLLQHESLFCRIRDDGGRIEFFIGWFSTGNTGDTFSSILLKKLGMLQIDLALDVYGD